MSLSPSILQAHPPTEAHNCQRMAVPSLPARLASPSRTDRPIHYRTDWPIHSGPMGPPLPNRLAHPLPDRLANSLPDRLASSLGTHRFAEAIFGFEIRHRKLLQRRLRARPVLGALHRDHHQKGPSEETVHRETLKQFLASKNELHFVPQTETGLGEKLRKNEPRQGGKSEPGLGGKVDPSWPEKAPIRRGKM